MTKIKFIFETKAKRQFWSIFAACILLFTSLALVVHEDYKGILFGVALGGAVYALLESVTLFLYKNFVFLGHNYMLVRVKSFFFKTILSNQLDSVEITENNLCIHLSNKSIDINTEGINKQDINQLHILISKFAKA